MKKSKILVPALAVLALGVAGATTATVAWFNVNAAQVGYAEKVSSDNVSAVTSTVQLGNFTITPDVTSLESGVSLTDAQGNSYVYVGEDTTDEVAATPAKKVGAVSIKLKVTYDGDLTSATEINAAWQESAGAVDVAISDETANAPSGGGLKFFASAPSGTSYAGSSSSELEFTAAQLKACVFTVSGDPAAANEPQTEALTFYYGIKGVDGTTADAFATYVIGLTAGAHA